MTFTYIYQLSPIYRDTLKNELDRYDVFGYIIFNCGSNTLLNITEIWKTLLLMEFFSGVILKRIKLNITEEVLFKGLVIDCSGAVDIVLVNMCN